MVDVGEEEVERAQPLHEAALDHLPLVRRHDPRDEVEREDAVGARVVAVDREADALVEEERVGDPDSLLEPRRRSSQRAARRAAGSAAAGSPGSRTSRRRTSRGRSRRSGRRRPRLRHRLRSRGGVRPPCSFRVIRRSLQGRQPNDRALDRRYRLASWHVRATPKSSGPLPPPLPPETRTVGQLVAETLKAVRRALVDGASDRRCRPRRSASSATGFSRSADAGDHPVRRCRRRDGVVRDRLVDRQRRAASLAGAASRPQSSASSSTCRSRF